MRTIQLEIEEETFERILRLADSRGCSWQEVVKDLLGQAQPSSSPEDGFLGLFQDEPDLIDEVVEEPMRAREQQPLRQPNGHSSTRH
jgi:hypothetical protein